MILECQLGGRIQTQVNGGLARSPGPRLMREPDSGKQGFYESSFLLYTY